MIIFPAIDIKDGVCVRLRQGDFSTAEQVADDPVKTAKAFAAAGARWLHAVDLDGAKTGRPVNLGILTGIARQAGLRVQAGGGIRDMGTLTAYLENGVERAILGSAAVKNPAFLCEALREYGERIAVGIDAKNRLVACEGWTDPCGIDFVELARRVEAVGVRTIIFTDISKDGLLGGPNFEQLREIGAAVSCGIVASGGVTGVGDVAALKDMGLYGAILGRALYAGRIDLKEAIEAAS